MMSTVTQQNEHCHWACAFSYTSFHFSECTSIRECCMQSALAVRLKCSGPQSSSYTFSSLDWKCAQVWKCFCPLYTQNVNMLTGKRKGSRYSEKTKSITISTTSYGWLGTVLSRISQRSRDSFVVRFLELIKSWLRTNYTAGGYVLVKCFSNIQDVIGTHKFASIWKRCFYGVSFTTRKWLLLVRTCFYHCKALLIRKKFLSSQSGWSLGT